MAAVLLATHVFSFFSRLEAGFDVRTEYNILDSNDKTFYGHFEIELCEK